MSTAGSFTTPRDAARDLDLQFDTRGLLWWMASHSATYLARLDEARIIALTGLGRDHLRRMMRELIAAGYLLRSRLRDAGGRLLAGVRYALNLRPDRGLLPRSACDGEPVAGAEQPQRDVSAAHTCDGFAVAGSIYREDTERKEGGSSSVTRAHDPAHTPQKIESEAPMPQTNRQTRLPIIVPSKTRPGRDLEPAAPGTVTQMPPQARALAAMSHVAATITDEWLQRCRQRPPTQLIRQVEGQVYDLVVEGIADDTIRRGMAAWMVKGYAPGAIPAFVNQVMNAGIGEPAARPSTTDARVAAALSLVGTFGEATG